MSRRDFLKTLFTVPLAAAASSASLADISAQSDDEREPAACEALRDEWVGSRYWPLGMSTFLRDTNEIMPLLARTSPRITIGLDAAGIDDLVSLTMLAESPEKGWSVVSLAWAIQGVADHALDPAALEIDLTKSHPLCIDRDVARTIKMIDRNHGSPCTIGISWDFPDVLINGLVGQDIDFDRFRGITKAQLKNAVRSCEHKLVRRELYHCDQPLLNHAVKFLPDCTGHTSTGAWMRAGTRLNPTHIGPALAAFRAVAVMVGTARDSEVADKRLRGSEA